MRGQMQREENGRQCDLREEGPVSEVKASLRVGSENGYRSENCLLGH